MPAKLDRCVKDVKNEGKSEDSAYAICNSSIDSTIEESILKQVLETKLKGCGCQKKKHS